MSGSDVPVAVPGDRSRDALAEDLCCELLIEESDAYSVVDSAWLQAVVADAVAAERAKTANEIGDKINERYQIMQEARTTPSYAEGYLDGLDLAEQFARRTAGSGTTKCTRACSEMHRFDSTCVLGPETTKEGK